MASKRKTAINAKPLKRRRGASRAEQLVDFLQDVALGKRDATEAAINEAAAELDTYLPIPPER